EENQVRLPVMLSGTVNESGRSQVSSQSLEAFWISIAHYDMLSVGLNCSIGVAQMRPFIEALSGLAGKPVSCYPNAGMPDGFGGFKGSSPEHFARTLREYARNGWVNLVGGCCGTTPKWIAALARAVEDVPSRKIPQVPQWSSYSG